MPRIRRPARFHPEARAARAARHLTAQTMQRARRARRHLIISIPLTALVVTAFVFRREVFGLDVPVRIATALALLVLGWSLARDIGRTLQPALFRRMDPATAGTAGFAVRFVFLVIASLIALRLAGLTPRTLAVGGAITAVIVGLAAQQTLGHLIAGLVLISARPFRVGDRVRLHAGGLAGQVEGRVASLGLLYTTLSQGQDSILVPNSVVLSAAAVPLREPAGVDLRARLRPDVRPSQVQALLHDRIRTPTLTEPHIALEEIDQDEVIVRIAATPEFEADGPRLADEILSAIEAITREVDTAEHAIRRVAREQAADLVGGDGRRVPTDAATADHDGGP